MKHSIVLLFVFILSIQFSLAQEKITNRSESKIGIQLSTDLVGWVEGFAGEISIDRKISDHWTGAIRARKSGGMAFRVGMSYDLFPKSTFSPYVGLEYEFKTWTTGFRGEGNRINSRNLIMPIGMRLDLSKTTSLLFGMETLSNLSNNQDDHFLSNLRLGVRIGL